jgi:hypothetical protein
MVPGLLRVRLRIGSRVPHTRAKINGDELVVNGSKIWTSFADQADFQKPLAFERGMGCPCSHASTLSIPDAPLPKPFTGRSASHC